MPTISRDAPVAGDQQPNTRLKPGQERETAMPTAMKDLPTCVALMLALVAAIVSTPGQAGGPYQVLRWIQVGVSPEVNMLAGAIGETPASWPEP
jgi:hypothetical protein